MAAMRHILSALVLVAALGGCSDNPREIGSDDAPQLETTDTRAPYPHVPTPETSAPASQGGATEFEHKYASAFAVGEDLEICETWYEQDKIGGVETVGCDEDGESIRVTWFADAAERDRYRQAVEGTGGANRAVLLADEYGVTCSPPARCTQLQDQGWGRLAD